jgi:hypothetical protein
MEQMTLIENDFAVEPERHYKPLDSFILDWNKLLFVQDDNGVELDWNKLIYNDEQLLELTLKQQERFLRPEHYEFLFSAPSQRTDMEKFFLSQSGFCIDEEDDFYEGEEEMIKRLVIDPSMQISNHDPADAK